MHFVLVVGPIQLRRDGMIDQIFVELMYGTSKTNIV